MSAVELADSQLTEVLAGRVHTSPLLLPDECERLIEAAEHRAAECGWRVNLRHSTVPTTDFPIAALDPAVAQWAADWMRKKVAPAFGRLFNIEPGQLHPQDLFIVRYEAAGQGQPGLPWHRDGSIVSFIAALNTPDQYQGGGTQFIDADGPIVRMDRGEVCMFTGSTSHCGVKVTSGVRYILAGFLDFVAPAALAAQCTGGTAAIEQFWPRLQGSDAICGHETGVKLFQYVHRWPAGIEPAVPLPETMVTVQQAVDAHQYWQNDDGIWHHSSVPASTGDQQLRSMHSRALTPLQKTRQKFDLDTSNLEAIDTPIDANDPVPELPVTLSTTEHNWQIAAILFVLPNGLVSLRLAGKPGNLWAQDGVVDYRGWLSLQNQFRMDKHLAAGLEAEAICSCDGSELMELCTVDGWGLKIDSEEQLVVVRQDCEGYEPTLWTIESRSVGDYSLVHCALGNALHTAHRHDIQSVPHCFMIDHVLSGVECDAFLEEAAGGKCQLTATTIEWLCSRCQAMLPNCTGIGPMFEFSNRCNQQLSIDLTAQAELSDDVQPAGQPAITMLLLLDEDIKVKLMTIEDAADADQTPGKVWQQTVVSPPKGSALFWMQGFSLCPWYALIGGDSPCGGVYAKGSVFTDTGN